MGIKSFYSLFNPEPLGHSDECTKFIDHVFVDFNNCYGKYLLNVKHIDSHLDNENLTQNFCSHLYSLIKPIKSVGINFVPWWIN